jgi:hypothetical protein
MHIFVLFLACVATGDGRRARQTTPYEIEQLQEDAAIKSLATLLLAPTAPRYARSSNVRSIAGGLVTVSLPRSAVVHMEEKEESKASDSWSKELESEVRQGVAQSIKKGKDKDKKKKQKAPKQKVKGPQAYAGMPLKSEREFFFGPPSVTETFIPGLSVLTVFGIIPFGASLARQIWTRYSITDRRFTVKSGFQGKDEVQFVWREVTNLSWLRRFGGRSGDMVFTLGDGARIEIRSVAEFDRNLAFVMSQLPEAAKEKIGDKYPDPPAKEYLAKVISGEEPAPDLDTLEKQKANEAA